MKNLRILITFFYLFTSIFSQPTNAQVKIIFPRPTPKHVVIDFEEDEIITVKRKPEEVPNIVKLTPKESEIKRGQNPDNIAISNRFIEGTDFIEKPTVGLTLKEIEDLENKKIMFMSEKAADEIDQLDDDLQNEINSYSAQFVNDDNTEKPESPNVTNLTIEQMSDNSALIDELHINLNSDEKAQFSRFFGVQFENPKHLVFQSDRANELNELKDKLDRTKPKTIHKQIAKKEAYINLQKADKSYLLGKPTIADIYFDTARVLLDIVTDFVPVISEAKDAIRGFAGKDPMTGQSIGSFERGFALGCLAVAVLSYGGSRYFKGLVKKAILHADEAFDISKGRLRTSMNLKSALIGVKSRVLLEGHKDGIVLIGRDMEYVRKVAAELRAEGIDVRIFDGEIEIGKEIKEEWDYLINESKSKGVRLENEFIENNTKTFPKNKEWINERMREGYNVVDLGNYKGDKSVFYDMELTEVGKFKEAWKR